MVEEEQCWREILHRRKERESREHGHRRSKSKHSSASKAKLQQALDAYERELRRETKRKLELSASGVSSSANDPEFWLNVARSQDTSDRWGHDGWEELQRPGPPITESFLSYPSESIRKQIVLKPPASKLPVKDNTPPTAPVPSKGDPRSSRPKLKDNSKVHKRNKKEKKHKKEKKSSVQSDQKVTPSKPPSEKEKRRDSRSSSISTIHSDEEIEWLERK